MSRKLAHSRYLQRQALQLSHGEHIQVFTQGNGSVEMTREEAYAGCPSDSYVEFYGGRWLTIPFAPIEQPAFFTCLPGNERLVDG